MAPKKLPDCTLLRQLLRYDAASGEFTWLPRPRKMFGNKRAWNAWNARYARKPAGHISADGYVTIRIGGANFKAHRLALLYVCGEPVPTEIDHIDRNRSNNRVSNLRTASRNQNRANSSVPRNSSSGVKGASFHSLTGKFQVYITHNGRRHHLGLFTTLEEAAMARREAAVRLHGEFARHA